MGGGDWMKAVKRHNFPGVREISSMDVTYDMTKTVNTAVWYIGKV